MKSNRYPITPGMMLNPPPAPPHTCPPRPWVQRACRGIGASSAWNTANRPENGGPL